MGDREARAPALVESTVGYHSFCTESLCYVSLVSIEVPSLCDSIILGYNMVQIEKNLLMERELQYNGSSTTEVNNL